MKIKFVIFSLVVVATFGSVSAFATLIDTSCPSCVQIPDEETLDLYKEILPIVIWTPDTTYDHQSQIVVNGHANNFDPNQPVIISVINPIGNLVYVDQIMIDDNGSFQTVLNTASPLWTQNGNYIIYAQNGSESRIFKTQVMILDVIGVKESCSASEIPAIADNGGVYCIGSSVLQGATGVEGTLDTQSKILTLNIRGTDVAFITLDIPRYILDSKTDSFDSDFVVLVNGEEANFNENPTSDDKRSLTIMFPPGDSEIEILGTSVIPEFGSIAALILGVAIVSIIVVSAKSRLQLIPIHNSN